MAIIPEYQTEPGREPDKGTVANRKGRSSGMRVPEAGTGGDVLVQRYNEHGDRVIVRVDKARKIGERFTVPGAVKKDKEGNALKDDKGNVIRHESQTLTVGQDPFAPGVMKTRRSGTLPAGSQLKAVHPGEGAIQLVEPDFFGQTQTARQLRDWFSRHPARDVNEAIGRTINLGGSRGGPVPLVEMGPREHIRVAEELLGKQLSMIHGEKRLVPEAAVSRVKTVLGQQAIDPSKAGKVHQANWLPLIDAAMRGQAPDFSDTMPQAEINSNGYMAPHHIALLTGAAHATGHVLHLINVEKGRLRAKNPDRSDEQIHQQASMNVRTKVSGIVGNLDKAAATFKALHAAAQAKEDSGQQLSLSEQSRLMTAKNELDGHHRKLRTFFGHSFQKLPLNWQASYTNHPNDKRQGDHVAIARLFVKLPSREGGRPKGEENYFNQGPEGSQAVAPSVTSTMADMARRPRQRPPRP